MVCNEFCIPVGSFHKKLRTNRPKQLDHLDEKVSAMVASPSFFALPKFTGLYIMETNDYDKPIDFVVLQKQEEETSRAVGYWPQILTAKEQKVAKKYRECSKVLLSMTVLCPYLEKIRHTFKIDYKETS